MYIARYHIATQHKYNARIARISEVIFEEVYGSFDEGSGAFLGYLDVIRVNASNLPRIYHLCPMPI
jgi:hypothetical protein